MTHFRHVMGLFLVLLFIFAGIWAWYAYPDLLRLRPLQAWRGILTTWRIPIFAISLFLLLSFLHWIASKLDNTEKS